jgi:hypothetical protein
VQWPVLANCDEVKPKSSSFESNKSKTLRFIANTIALVLSGASAYSLWGALDDIVSHLLNLRGAESFVHTAMLMLLALLTGLPALWLAPGQWLVVVPFAICVPLCYLPPKPYNRYYGLLLGTAMAISTAALSLLVSRIRLRRLQM